MSKHKFILATSRLLLTVAMATTLAACNQQVNVKESPSAGTQHAKPSEVSLGSFAPASKANNVVFELPNWENTSEQIAASTNESIAVGNQMLDKIARLPSERLTFDNTLMALDSAYFHVLKTSERMDVIRETSPDKSIRDAAFEASKTLSSWFIDASFRQDVYQSIKSFAATRPDLQGEDAMLLKITLRDYRRNGMDLSEHKRKEMQALKTELSNMGLEFARNISDANDTIEFTAEELKGVSGDFLNNDKLKTDSGTYKINVNVTWQVLEVYRNAANEETRQKLSVLRSSRAMEKNTPLFTKILKTRAQIATLLGYDNWADYRIEPKMAKTGANALDFELKLKHALQNKYDQEMETFRQLKVAETGNTDARIRYWDVPYYKNKLKKTEYNVDSDKLKVFFEFEQTLNGMFAIFEELFELNIQQTKAPYKWVDDLRLYAVSDSKTGAPLGLIYMDMFPREGKFNHFAQFGITPGKQLENGKHQRPVVALICNFPPATEDKPSLLTHDHVETLFHEFGHALHSVLTQTRYATFSGTSVPRDFVEAPSQMLENWVWDKKLLDRFARDYRDQSKRIPGDVLDKMEQAKLAVVATRYRRQLGFGLLDLNIHSTTDEQIFDNVTQITNQIMGDTYVPVPDNTGFVASFGHLGGGYDAGYYGYAWADSISADMASVFEQSPGGLMDHTVGRRLRDEIYATGGSREIDESIHAFLGRERSMDAFEKQIGLKD